jgi:hypothetical protein
VPSAGTLNGGRHWTLNGLIPGRRYTASMRVAVAQGCGDVTPYASNNATLVNRISYRSAKPDPSNKRWRTVWVTFDVSASTTTLGLFVDRTTMAAGQSSIFWFDGILVEEGAAVRPYFDGSMGADYLWEASGTANLTRSYYYENYTERSYLIRTLLDENTPLGITSSVPQYAVLPTQ